MEIKGRALLFIMNNPYNVKTIKRFLEKTKEKPENETISCQVRDMKGAPAFLGDNWVKM